ncbi:MAG: alpha/beta fold hydrolase [Chitinophagaceae bacterium]
MGNSLFTSKNISCAYQVIGSGLPVMLIHGFGEDSCVWEKQLMALKDKYQLIIPDLPGCGKSVLSVDCDMHILSSIDLLADLMVQILQQEEIANWVVIGHSMGGYIALAMAEKYPERLRGLGLVHSTAFADSEEKKQIRTKGIAAMNAYGAEAFIKNTTPNLFTLSFKENKPSIVASFIEMGINSSVEALKCYYLAMRNRPDRTSILQNFDKPVMLIAGTQDIAVPLNDSLKMAAMPQKMLFTCLDGIGHMGQTETPEMVNNTIMNFLQLIENNK